MLSPSRLLLRARVPLICGKWASFSATAGTDTRDMFCGLGDAQVTPSSIRISSYPFEPSSVFPSKTLRPEEVCQADLSGAPPSLTLTHRNEIIFISALERDALQVFAETNNIPVSPTRHNWELITVPYLDRIVDEQENEFTIRTLEEKGGVSELETLQLRGEIGAAMKKYNIDSGLWDDFSLSLSDVLQAMRAVLSPEEYHEFYWNAMEVETRRGAGEDEERRAAP